ncbi:class I SAM-dependent methyltransferase [Pleurocapsa sp. PCC 7319]|uniref:class I SAM-dependent methyltransferase n=1 Tax=Pleurocapsa sp. PCC 7319 TaxID=118161 RepID=UPI00034D09C7|nr:class I SAM-dependent methyltransferase [Pleurocapsa sp. PCC 7319]
MKNATNWKPTKIENRGDKFYVNELGVSSGSLFMTLEDFRVINSFKSYLKGHLIDLGCGNAPYYQWYKDRVDRVTCIDWPQSKQSKNDAKYVDVFANLNESVPLEDNSVDFVFSTSVLEHICEPLILLKEISRILKSDGYLLLSVPFIYNLHEEPYDYYRYTPYSLEHLAEKAGLEIVSLKHYGCGFGVLIDVSSKIIQALIEVIRKSLPRYIGSPISKLGNMQLRLFQQISFIVLNQKQIVNIIERANLSSRIALGYVAILKIKQNTEI